MTEYKKTNGWKVTAIIFIILFTLQMSFMIWGVTLVLEEEKNTDECYYDICEDYINAYFEEDVCYCYNADNEVVKTELMN